MEFWTLARAREVSAGLFVRAGMLGVVLDSTIAGLRCLQSGFVGSVDGELCRAAVGEVDFLQV
jgi:hypothetical protein